MFETIENDLQSKHDRTIEALRCERRIFFAVAVLIVIYIIALKFLGY